MGAPRIGRPRRTKKWQTTMRHEFVVDFATDRAVHTALHMEGGNANEFIGEALRDYLVKINHPALSTEMQRQAVVEGLGLKDGESFGASLHIAPQPSEFRAGDTSSVKHAPEPLVPPPAANPSLHQSGMANPAAASQVPPPSDHRQVAPLIYQATPAVDSYSTQNVPSSDDIDDLNRFALSQLHEG